MDESNGPGNSPFQLRTNPLPEANEAHRWLNELHAKSAGGIDEIQLNSLLSIADDVCSVEIPMLIIELCLKSDKLNYDQKKSILEKMTIFPGHNLAMGHRIWKAYLDFETAANRPKILSRAAKIPLIEGKRLLDDGSINFSSPPAFIAEYEEKIADASNDKDKLLLLFESYLEKLMKEFKKEPAIMRAQFERASESLFDQERIWLRYIAFLKKEFNVKTILFRVLNRAVSAGFKCKESFTEIWLEMLHFLEMNNPGEIDEIVKFKLDPKSINKELYAQIVQYYLGYIRRATHLDLETKRKMVFTNFGRWKRIFTDNDEILVACVETLGLIYDQLKDSTSSVKVWEDHVSQFSKSAHFWVKFAQWKLRTEGIEEAEKVYKRGAASEPVPFELFVGKWKEFAYQFGTPDSVGNALDKIVTWKLKSNPFKVAPSKESAVKRTRPEVGVVEEPKKSKVEELPVQVELPPLNKDLTIFVNNLDFDIKESFLRTFFAEHAGKLRSLRLVKNAKGQSRGFATIDFEDEESHKKALKLDRTRLNGRPVFISPYQDVGSASFKTPVQHPTGRNPKTLFVSQLPPDCFEENLRELFSPYEGFRAVRLGLKKDGSSKGFAYVDFGSEAQAAKALEMDGKIVGGNVISVLISDPSLAPKRQHQKKSMVPPTISKQQIAKKADELQQQDEKQPESSPTVVSGATNEDFRKMLGL